MPAFCGRFWQVADRCGAVRLLSTARGVLDLDALDAGVTTSQTGRTTRRRADLQWLEKKSSDFNGFC
jgi:hypothetical protein